MEFRVQAVDFRVQDVEFGVQVSKDVGPNGRVGI